MKPRLLLLFVPLLVTVAILLGLNSSHPGVEGSLVINDGTELGLNFEETLGLKTSGLRDITIRTVPVILSAEQISIGGVSGRTFESIRLEPAEGFQVTQDFEKPTDEGKGVTSRNEQTELPPGSFKITGSKNGTLHLRHESGEDGFFLFFSTLGDWQGDFKVLYKPSPSTIKLQVTGCKITRPAGTIQEVANDKTVEISLKSLKSPSSVSFKAGPSGTPNYLQLAYRVGGSEEKLQLFSAFELKEGVQLASNVPIKSSGNVQLHIDGERPTDLYNRALLLRGDNLVIDRDLQGGQKGLTTSCSGNISSLEEVPSSALRHGSYPQSIEETSLKPKSVLPSRLSRITPFYTILFAAVAYLIDKVITVFKFLQPAKEPK